MKVAGLFRDSGARAIILSSQMNLTCSTTNSFEDT